MFFFVKFSNLEAGQPQFSAEMGLGGHVGVTHLGEAFDEEVVAAMIRGHILADFGELLEGLRGQNLYTIDNILLTILWIIVYSSSSSSSSHGCTY